MSAGDFIDLGIEGITDAVAIGAGGAAMVYRARQPRLNRTVAVKVIQAVGDDASTRRFAREARALGQLSEHPGIVTVYDVGSTPTGQPYLIMQYCEAGSLQDRLHQQGPLPADEVVTIAGAIAEALAHAHEQGIMHRDLKPANILVSNRGRHLVADFGIAALADTSAIVSTAVSFTPGYAPPETIQGEPASPASDVYSLGATMYALLTGKHPFAEDGESNIYTLINRILNQELEDTRVHGVPEPVAALVDDCTAKTPATRPTMQEVARRLSGADAQAAPVPPPPVPPTFVAPGAGPSGPSAAPPTTGPPPDAEAAPLTAGPPSAGPPAAPVPIGSADGGLPPRDHTDGASRSRWWVAAGLLAVVIAVIVGVVVLPGGDSDPEGDDTVASTVPTTSTMETTTTGQTTATAVAADPVVVDTLTVGSEPQDLLTTEDSVWVAARTDGEVSVHDPVRLDAPPEVIGVGAEPLRPVAADGRVWVANDGDGTVSVIDPEQRSVVATVDVGERPRPPALLGGRVWVPVPGAIVMIDSDRLEVVGSIPVPGRPRTPLMAEGLVWVPDINGDTVSVIDPESESVIDTITVGQSPLRPLAVEGNVWVVGEDSADVSVVDPASRQVIDTIPVGRRPVNPVVTAGQMWVPNFDDGTMTVIDVVSREVVDTIELGAGVAAPVVYQDQVWVPLQQEQVVVAIDPDSREVVARVPVGAQASQPGVAADRLFVPNRADGTMTVIELA